MDQLGKCYPIIEKPNLKKAYISLTELHNCGCVENAITALNELILSWMVNFFLMKYDVGQSK